MRKIMVLLGFLLLMPVSPTLYAQDGAQYDDLGSNLFVYSLIIGIYAFYWLKQKV